MGSDEEDLYLQKLNDFIFDEDKIITFAWLSRELKVGPQRARELLTSFVKDHRSLKPNDLSTSWILSGVLKETGNITVCLAREQELEVKKNLFDPLVSELIYSVQKANEVDLNVISMVDNLDINKDTKFLIAGRNCIKRNVRVKFVVPETQRAAPVDKTKASHLFGKVKVDTSEPKIKIEKVSPKKSTTIKISPKNEVTNKAKKGGLASFFTKGPVIKTETKPKVKPEEEVIEVDKEEEEKKTDVVEVEKEETAKRKTDTFFDSDTDEEAQKIEARNKRQKVEEKSKPKTSKRKNDSSTERPKKKRKRIVQRNDSDSDDMFADEEKREDDDEDIVLSDNEETFSINVSKETSKPKNKRRKQVEKNFMDEDGYMITKKEWVTVSASDSSEEEKEQKNPQTKKETSLPKKISPIKPAVKLKKQQPANQKTLMDFFKKK